MEALRDSLTDIWDNLKVFSFYELWKAPTVQNEVNIPEIFACTLRADVFSLAYYGRVENIWAGTGDGKEGVSSVAFEE